MKDLSIFLVFNFGLQALDNGLLVDPHNQQSIADALLKLVAERQLWSRCRQNGLKNIHLYSWPQHCKTYLARIACCKPRHPQWQKSDDDDNYDDSDSDSPGSSLRDIKDISLNLKISLDSEKNEGSGAIVDALKSEQKALTPSKGGSIEKSENEKFPALKRRKFIFVICVDYEMTSDFLDTIKTVLEVAVKERSSGSIGFILSTGSKISEIYSLLKSGGVDHMSFDAFICNSGGETYYPTHNSEDNPSGLPFMVDFDYCTHIDYRWGGEGLRKTLTSFASSLNEKNKKDGPVIVEDNSESSHCYAFKVKSPASVSPFKQCYKNSCDNISPFLY